MLLRTVCSLRVGGGLPVFHEVRTIIQGKGVGGCSLWDRWLSSERMKFLFAPEIGVHFGEECEVEVKRVFARTPEV